MPDAEKAPYYDCLHEHDPEIAKLDSIRKNLNAAQLVYRLDTLFRAKVKYGFNGNVLIAKKDVIIYEKSFGLENYATKDSLTPLSKFQLASISKQFTSVAILKLMEEGKLSLQNTVDQYFPGFPYANVTIENLLTHRSGLPEYMHVFSSKMKPYQVADNNQIIDWLISEHPKGMFKVNTKFTYCNTNYVILASIVEKAGGMPFEMYMQQKVFEQLSMKNTFILTGSDARINDHRTFGYTPKWEAYGTDFFDGVVGDKGVYTTTEDMFLWSKMLRGTCFLSANTLRESFLPRSYEKAGVKNYGYGFRSLNYVDYDNRLIYHNGWWKGYNTCFYMCPKDDFVIIILGNKLCRNNYAVQGIIDILKGKAGANGEDMGEE
jgi:CubicO group peptidase (beta-lactamase class C family)